MESGTCLKPQGPLKYAYDEAKTYRCFDENKYLFSSKQIKGTKKAPCRVRFLAGWMPEAIPFGIS
ncbi:MAG: hypothetical protein SPF56_03620 [Bacteroidaceae bacterium]|nr:hypothetical protein [Bacteroidaceae bacterium]